MTVDERESLVNDLCMGFMTLGADMAELKNMLYVILEPYEITTRSTAVAEVTLELPDLEDTTGPARCITGQSGTCVGKRAVSCRLVHKSRHVAVFARDKGPDIHLTYVELVIMDRERRRHE